MKVGKAGGEKWKSMSKAVSSQYHLKLLGLVGMCMDNELCQPLLRWSPLTWKIPWILFVKVMHKTSIVASLDLAIHRSHVR